MTDTSGPQMCEYRSVLIAERGCPKAAIGHHRCCELHLEPSTQHRYLYGHANFDGEREIRLQQGEIDSDVVLHALVLPGAESLRVQSATLIQLALTYQALVQARNRCRDHRSLDTTSFVADFDDTPIGIDAPDIDRTITVLDSHFVHATTVRSLDFGQAVDLLRSTFDERLDINSCRFDRTFSIGGSTFTARCSIVDTRFKSRVDLTAQFDNGLIVQQCDFDSTLDLVEGSSQSAVGSQSFSRCSFSGDIFLGAGDVVFIRPRFDGDLVMQLGSCTVSFERMTLRNPLQLRTDPTTGGAVLAGIVDSVLTEPIAIDSTIDASLCSFRGTSGLEHVIFRSPPTWTRTTPRFGSGRALLHDETAGVDDAELESLYRQLRRALEASKAYAAASDFFYGEMEARRRQRTIGDSDWWLLGAFKHIGGYGVRPSRPLAWLLAMITTVSLTLRLAGATLTTPTPAPQPANPFDNIGDVVAFVTRNSLALFRATTDGLTWQGSLLIQATRLIAVTLVGLAAIGLRSRVRR